MSDDVLAVLNGQTARRDTSRVVEDTEPVLWGEIRCLIEDSIVNAPRSLQKHIGPSELGTDCVHCLAAKLAGWAHTRTAAWLPFIGTCVHEHFERFFTQLADSESYQGRFETEKRVTVGRLQGLQGGYDVSGSIDLWDVQSAATVDWKIVGPTTLRSVKANGPSQQYLVQASLYGLGLLADGLTVERSCIYYLPRSAVSLSDGFAYEQDFDPELGRWALTRAQLVVSLLDVIEQTTSVQVRDAWIRSLPRAVDVGGHCFDCALFPDAGVASEFTRDTVEVPSQFQEFSHLIAPRFSK